MGRDLNGKMVGSRQRTLAVQCKSSHVQVWCKWEYREVTVSFLENGLVVLLDIVLHYFISRTK